MVPLGKFKIGTTQWSKAVDIMTEKGKSLAGLETQLATHFVAVLENNQSE